MGNWTNTGRIYPANLSGYNWSSVDPTVPSDDHTGGGNCLYVNGNSNYVTAGAGNYILYRIESSAISLAGWDNTRLEFWMQMRSETGNWDGGFVDWSHDGINWTQLNTELCVPYDGNMSNNAASTPFYPNLKPAWFNLKTTWTRVLVNLSAIDNVSSFYLRFTFHSDEEAMDRGWAIDDIKIVSVAMIQLQGNNLVIPAGNAPITANNTDFGACSVGQFIDKEFYIHNTGESPLTLTGNPYVTTTGAGFTVLTQPATNNILPGTSVPFTVRFQPGSVGNFNGTVSIPHSDIYSACTVMNPFVYNIKASALNTPPQVANLADTSVCPGAGPITMNFTVSDVEQAPALITCSATSSNQAAIPNANISFSGTGNSRQISFTALSGQLGAVTITVTANDGQAVNNTSSESFTVVLADSMPPTALCQNVQVQLASTGLATISPQQVDAGSFDDCLLANITVSQSQFSCADVGVNNLIFEAVDAVGLSSQCNFQATVLPPSGSLNLDALTYVGGYEISCAGASDGTIEASAQGGCAPYTYSWIEVPGNTGNQASGLAAGTYHVEATDAAGQTWDAQITLDEPSALVDGSTAEDVSCFEKADGKIHLLATGGNMPYSFSAGPEITGLPAGNYTYTIQDANGCELSINLGINEPAEIILNITDLVSAQCGEEMKLLAEAYNGTGTLNFTWSGIGIACENCASTVALASETSVYDVTVTDANNCTKTAQVLAEVNCNVYVPNAFTPHNGDLLNPFFKVYTGTIESFSFSIYNRWGELMFSSSNPDDGWNGFSGKKMAEQGLYVYRLIYRFPGGLEHVMLGSVSLLGGN